ncbi:MAG: hypothetical protein JW860_10935 [Sedimentisphaerales bacterium]|nr:hypothetical protein [Sedimentisphaerales bacterium]
MSDSNVNKDKDDDKKYVNITAFLMQMIFVGLIVSVTYIVGNDNLDIPIFLVAIMSSIIPKLWFSVYSLESRIAKLEKDREGLN